MTLWVVKGGPDRERETYNLMHRASTFGWNQLPDLARKVRGTRYGVSRQRRPICPVPLHPA